MVTDVSLDEQIMWPDELMTVIGPDDWLRPDRRN